MYKAIDVYLQKTKARQYVGRLSKVKRHFVFEYDEGYWYSGHPLPFGPDLPISKQRHSSVRLFPSFEDRIPSKKNPAYREYCQSVGISPSEKNPFVLLAKLGRKGPSSFIIAPVWEKPSFSNEDLKKFRKDLNLSMKEFSDLFDVSTASIYRIENHKMSGTQVLKKISVYYNFPKTALDKLKYTGHKINDQKRQFVCNFFKLKIQEKISSLGYGPFTVKAEDVKNCSPQQAVELLRRLILLECSHYGIPRNSVHISSNISARDGGQDGLAAEWSQWPAQTNYFPHRYNCFQMKATGSMSSSKAIKEISDKGNPEKLNKAVQEVIRNKGAYILCSTHGVAGVRLQEIESAIKKEIQAKVNSVDNIQAKFYDGNRMADWINCFPNVAIWFLKEVCGRDISPWISWLEWSRDDPDYRSKFMTHSDLNKKRERIRNILSQPRGAVHLTGASGLGKTRLALEAFRPIYRESEYSNKHLNNKSDPSKTGDCLDKEEDLSPLVLYSSAENLKEGNLRELKISRAILIIDDCSLEKAEAFHKIAVQEDARFSLLTIGQDEKTAKGAWAIIREKTSEGEKTREAEKYLIKLEPDENIVKKMLSDNQNIEGQFIESKCLQLTSGFPLMAKLLKEAGPVDLLKEDGSTIRKKMLWGLEEPDQEAEKVIKSCSLFDAICFSDQSHGIRSLTDNRREEEAKYIAEKICNLDYDTFYKKIQFFKKKKIIQQYGRFIQVRPKPLAIWLAVELIEETPLKSITKWLVDMKAHQKSQELSLENQKLTQKLNAELSGIKKTAIIKWQTEQSMLNGLRESFCRQLAYLGSFSDAQKLAKRLCEEGGFFGRKENLNTEWGFRCFHHLAELNPAVALQTLKRIFGNKNAKELKNILGQASLALGRINIPSALIWTLQKLAVRKELYPQSTRLLLKFAEWEEDSRWSSSATEVFTDHFYLYFSGTEAAPDEKFQVIDEIKKSQSVKQKEIAIKALDKALQTEGFESSLDIMQTKSGKVFEEWRPKTDKELRDYLQLALNNLVEFATQDENKEIKKKAMESITHNLNPLLIKGLYDDVKTAIKTVISVHGAHWPSAVSQLLMFLKYHSKEMKKKPIQKIHAMIKLLQPTENINKRIKFYITECSWNYMYNELQEKTDSEYNREFKRQNLEYNKKFKQLLKDFKNHLEKGSEEQIASSFKILFHGEQSNNTIHFARELAGSLLKPPFSMNSDRIKIKTERQTKTDYISTKAFFLRWIDLMLKVVAKWKKDEDFNPAFLCGFLSGLNELDSKAAQSILDQIAEDACLSDLIIPAYRGINLKDQDISRLMKIIGENKTDLNWGRLGELFSWERCQSVSPKRIEELMAILSKKTVKHSWVALKIYHYYTHDFTLEKKKDFLPVLYKLLTQKNLLSAKKAYKTMADHYYKNIVGDILDSDYGESFSKIFISQMFNSKNSWFDFSISNLTIKECFIKILKKYPDRFLSEITNNIDSPKIKFIFKDKSFLSHLSLNHKFSPLSFLTEAQLKNWCKKTPDKIPIFLAKNMNLFSYNNDKGFDSWSPFAKFLLDEYGEQSSLTDAISMNLFLFSGFGNQSNYFEKIKKAMEDLRNHKHKNVRDFYEEKTSDLKKQIEQHKQREKERDELGIW